MFLTNLSQLRSIFTDFYAWFSQVVKWKLFEAKIHSIICLSENDFRQKSGFLQYRYRPPAPYSGIGGSLGYVSKKLNCGINSTNATFQTYPGRVAAPSLIRTKTPIFPLQVFDHVIQRNERLSKAIRGDADISNGEVDSSLKGEDANSESEAKEASSEKEAAAQEESKEEESDKPNPVASLDEQVKDWNTQLVKENKNLHRLNTSLHERNHFLSLKQAEFEESINAEITKNEELQNKVDDLEYELTKCRMRNTKLESVLIDTQVKTPKICIWTKV